MNVSMSYQILTYWLILLLLVQSTALARYSNSPHDLGFYSGSSYSSVDLDWGYDLTDLKNSLKSASQNETINSVEDLLPVLPQQLRANYVIMYQSRSLQQASDENPRIIMFTPRADFILTFNGHRSQRGFDKLELINFDYKTNNFNFHEISFDKTQGYQISAANPPACLKCHQSPSRTNINPRPNWEPYSTWPGAIGSLDGNFAKDKNEEIILNNFINNKSSHPRYKHLLDPEISSYSIRTPGDLTNFLSELNAKRVVTEIKQLPIYNDIKETFLSSIKCGNLNVSDSAFKWLEKNKKFTEILGDLESDSPISQLIHLTFEPFDIDTTDWSMDFKTRGRLAFRERFGSPSQTSNHFLRAINEFIPEHINFSCSQLGSFSAAKMDRLISQYQLKKSNEIEITESVRLKKMLTNCMSCHDGSNGDPIISFDRPNLLKKELHRPGFENGTLLQEIKYRLGDMAPFHKAMPANQVLKKEDTDLILRYFENL